MIIVGAKDTTPWPMLVTPDGAGPWVLRYIWFKHADNNAFIDGYFSGSNLGLSMRKLTTDLKTLWVPHNNALKEAANQNALVYRVKVLNKLNESIDHIEVWRSETVVQKYMHDEKWKQEREELGMQLRTRGFSIRRVTSPYPLISISNAMRAYATFTARHTAQDACNVFTPIRYNKNNKNSG